MFLDTEKAIEKHQWLYKTAITQSSKFTIMNRAFPTLSLDEMWLGRVGNAQNVRRYSLDTLAID